MKTINETFTDEEFKAIDNEKEARGCSWHDFILGMATRKLK